jgi:outer membrane usher protein
VELKETQKTVIPRSGSIQLVEFAAEPGRPLFVQFNSQSKQGIPFGAAVLDEHNHPLGFVGSDGVAYVRVLADQGTFQIRDEAGLTCVAPYVVTPSDAANSQFQHIIVDCHTP